MKTKIEWIRTCDDVPQKYKNILLTDDDIIFSGFYDGKIFRHADESISCIYPEYWCYFPDTPRELCERTINLMNKKEQKFKEGDEIILNVENNKFISTFIQYDNNLKDFIWIDITGLGKTLVQERICEKNKLDNKKEPKFNTGDRIVYLHDGNNNTKSKGTVLKDFENGNIQISWDTFPSWCIVNQNRCKKIRLNNVELKLGDRVIIKDGVFEGKKGMYIKQCNPCALLSIIKLDDDLDNNAVTNIPMWFLKKLIKKVKK